MRKIVIYALLVLSISLVSQAQETPATLPAGVAFPAQLISKLNSHKSKVGDEVKLEVTANLHGPGGVVVLPKGAKLIGTVSEVKDRNAADGQSEISFLITKAEWHGGSMALHAAPTAVTAPRVREQRESRNGGGDAAGMESGGGRRGGGGADSSTTSLLAAAIAMDIKGVAVRPATDAAIGSVFFAQKDVSLPTGAVITVRQF